MIRVSKNQLVFQRSERARPPQKCQRGQLCSLFALNPEQIQVTLAPHFREQNSNRLVSCRIYVGNLDKDVPPEKEEQSVVASDA